MSSIKDYVRHLHTVYVNALDEQSPTVEVNDTLLKVGLHPHQKAVLHRMETMEQSLQSGMTIDSEKVYSNYGILGDSVGSGKSLMVLGHIARLSALPTISTQNSIHPSSSQSFFSIKTKEYTDISEANSLIVVPHTLYRQWADYIKKQTNLSAVCLARSSQLADETLFETVRKAHVVLISNTLFRNFIHYCNQMRLRWKRVFIDEADTIHITGSIGAEHMPSRFTWLITASWINLLYLNSNLYFDKQYIKQHLLGGPDSNPDYAHLIPHFKSRISSTSHTYYMIEHMNTRSVGFLRTIVNPSHPLRASVVISCKQEFIQTSISLPPLFRHIIWCKEPYVNQIVRDAVTPEIRQMLNGGDTKSALEALGVKGQDMTGLIDAVTASLQKELDRLEKTREFKASLEYSSATAKQTALTTLDERIQRTKNSIQAIQDRIKGCETEMCPICYDDPTDHLITPCCSRVFCAACLLMSLARNPECPLCRGAIKASNCTKLLLKKETSAETNEIVDSVKPEFRTKNETLLLLLKQNPKGKFLIFSRYENTFEMIHTAVEKMNVSVKHLKGSKDTIASTLRQFEAGTVRCLLLNSQFAGAGLNITAATHVVLLHAMTHEEEKQILGRAYRAGRRGPLEFIKLLNKDEETYVGEEEVVFTSLEDDE